MAANPLEQLKLLSEEIEQEERAGQGVPCVALLLRALRMQLYLEVMDAAPARFQFLLRRDWSEAAELVRRLSETPKLTGQVLSDTLDLVLLPNPGRRQQLLKQLDLMTRIKIRESSPLSPPVKYIALDMADFCLNTDREELLRDLIRNLIFLGERRNMGHPEIQRVIVVDALQYIVDLDRALTAQLCKIQQRYFEGIVAQDACDFYWMYGLSMLSLNDKASSGPLLRRCHELCMAVEGETSWLGVKAGTLYHYDLLHTDRSAEAEAYLWDVLKKIDSGFYPDMDESADYTAAATRFVLLDRCFDRGQLRDHLDDILALLAYCVSVEDTNTVPFLTVRKAENMLSVYHLEAGEPLLAATHAQLALSSIPPNGLPKDPSDILLYTNLLLIYKQLHDEDQIEFYTRKLLDLSGEWENDPYLRDRIDGLIFSGQSPAPSDEEDLEYNRFVLAETLENIRNGDIVPEKSPTKNIAYAWSVINMCLPIIEFPGTGEEELLQIRFVMEYFRNRPNIYPFNDSQKLIYYFFQAQIEDLLSGPRVLEYLNHAWQYMDSLLQGTAARITLLRAFSIHYFSYGERDRALETARLLLSDVTAAWQHATTYFNDHRVCQVLDTVQDDFDICYGLMHSMLSSEELYDQILRFKDLPALVGRERNTRLQATPVDGELISGLHDLQDRLAEAELNDRLRGTDTARELREDLERVEAGISAQFTEAVPFTDITFGGVCRKLPDHSAIVEYYFVPDEKSFSLQVETPEWELDIFVTVKRNGQTQLHHLKCPEGTRLMQEAEDYSGILQDPDDLSASGRKATLRASLYRKLISPALPWLDGITHLYIAPDDMLCNIPFEILYGDDRIPLQDRFRICRLVCGRDLLFHDAQSSAGGGSFVLGDPNYEAERGQRTQSRTRSSHSSLEPVDALPFSGVEARCIGRRCHSSIHTGDSATKYALRDALPCRIIHLATHGVYDENLETDSLYSSHLVFAGYNKWARNQTESSCCGNGILTADEISRMDLNQTELVVLSACHSGIGDTSYGSVRGLLSAFSAAGARWIISHIWEASDFTTPILMDAFYDAWLQRGLDVPDALQYAKNYLKTITIGQLRSEGWLDLPRDIAFPEDIRDAAEEMRYWPDQEMPFQDEYYWGGFTVHKSK